MRPTTEQAFETVVECHLLANGYVTVAPAGFDRARAIFPETVLAFVRETQPAEWAKLGALHGESAGEQVLVDLCKWMDALPGGRLGSQARQYHRGDCGPREEGMAHEGVASNTKRRDDRQQLVIGGLPVRVVAGVEQHVDEPESPGWVPD